MACWTPSSREKKSSLLWPIGCRSRPADDMDYDESVRYLNRLGNEVLGMRFGLETIRALLRTLGDPQQNFPSVLVAGTNGKGSVASFLANILSSGGFRTGLYLSPHVVQLEERFQIDGQLISRSDVAACLSQVADAVRKSGCQPTYFETVTATAFLYFSRYAVQVAVLEVGMGGRLDSTNVVDPLLSVMTPIGLDHQKQLGPTIEQIAGEKAGIIHQSRPVLTAPQVPEVYSVLCSRAEVLQAPFHKLQENEISVVNFEEGKSSLTFHGVTATPRLLGAHQLQNAALAIRAAELLAPRFTVSRAAMAQGIERTRIPGRIQRISEKPVILVDGGHNRQAAANLVRFVGAETAKPRALVFSMMRDKDIQEVAEILRPAFDRVFVTEMQSPRAASVSQLLEAFPEATAVKRVADALEEAKASSVATIVVFGSFYLAGEVLRLRIG
ncbi:MAG: bifunctional folylpolyglutamate synthase/dihydrofolate synthase [Acidobacteria bacterium]|nr:MAG: bifunctional folylpolyglutamate synthase/dihydrofolate synthase [Acidobacteriota bacterium]